MLSSARAARICAAVMIRDPSTTGRTEPYRIGMHYAGSTIIFNACPIKVDGVRKVVSEHWRVGDQPAASGDMEPQQWVPFLP